MALQGWSQSVAHNSLFAGGKWVKIETISTGIHKINYSWLRNIGFLHPENVKLFGSRNEKMSRWNSISADNSPIQIPVLRFTEAGGSESLIFYVKGPVDWNYDPVPKQFYPTRNQSAIGQLNRFILNRPKYIFRQATGLIPSTTAVGGCDDHAPPRIGTRTNFVI